MKLKMDILSSFSKANEFPKNNNQITIVSLNIRSVLNVLPEICSAKIING